MVKLFMLFFFSFIASILFMKAMFRLVECPNKKLVAKLDIWVFSAMLISLDTAVISGIYILFQILKQFF